MSSSNIRMVFQNQYIYKTYKYQISITSVVFEVDMPNTFTIRDGPYGGEEYQFLQLHFHWGSVDSQGSEHTINGTRYVNYIVIG